MRRWFVRDELGAMCALRELVEAAWQFYRAFPSAPVFRSEHARDKAQAIHKTIAFGAWE